jgi:hypothetical protein
MTVAEKREARHKPPKPEERLPEPWKPHVSLRTVVQRRCDVTQKLLVVHFGSPEMRQRFLVAQRTERSMLRRANAVLRATGLKKRAKDSSYHEY